jgi:uncharacterized membrane protein YfcA
MELLLFIAAGLAAGFMSGLLGIGGGLVLVPVLAAVFSMQHVDPAVVMPLTLGTSLATIMFTSLSSLRAHHQRGTVDWAIVQRMGPGVAIGAVCGALGATQLPAGAVQTGFIIFASIAATQLLCGADARSARPLPPTATLAASGTVIGVVSGIVGGGAGTLTVPLLTWCSVSVRTAIGSAAALGFPIAVAGTAAFAVSGAQVSGLPPLSIGFVHLPAVAFVAIASILSAPLGASISHRLPISTLRRLFAIALYGVAAKMVAIAF